MNRTLLLLVSAAVLAIVAVVAGGSPKTVPVPVVAVVAPAPVAPAPALAPVAPTGRSTGALTLTGRTSSSRVLAGASTTYVKLDVAAPESNEKPHRVPVNLAVVIDHSGSMSGNKMVQARNAANALVDQLRDGDRLAVVAFDDRTELFPSTPINGGSVRELHEFINRIYEAGGTNISAGLDVGYEAIRPYAKEFKVSRVVLLSDGQPSNGDVSVEGICGRAVQARTFGVSTSAFGIGLDFNANLMHELANKGAGGYAFIENASNLGLAFAHELGDAAQTMARSVRVSLRPAEGVTIIEVPGHAFTRVDNGIESELYDFGPGQSAQLLVKLQVSAPRSGAVSLGTATVTYQDVKAGTEARGTVTLAAVVGSDDADVAAHADPEVMEMAQRVDIATRVVEAQAAYERGDTQLAFNLMGNVRRLFGSSADALAGEDELEGNWRRGGDDARRANMGLTKKTMKNFGQNNTASY